MNEHDVRHDTAGGHVRLTCYSEACKEATLVAQPWMSQEVFDAKAVEFMAAHPAEVVPCADRGGRTLRGTVRAWRP